MGGIKRFCLFVFGLAGALCLCALALPWVGPYQNEATDLMSNPTYYFVVQITLAITAFGVLVTLLRSVFSPRKAKSVVVSNEGGDQITVAKAAITSQATHLVEDGDRFVAEKVRVGLHRGSKVDVDVRVRPRRVVNVATEGKRLHDDLALGLASICGDRVRHVNLEFVEAEAPTPAEDVVVETLEVPSSVYEHAAQLAEAEEPSDITVPLSSVSPVPSVAAEDPQDVPETQDVPEEQDVAEEQPDTDEGEEA